MANQSTERADMSPLIARDIDDQRRPVFADASKPCTEVVRRPAELKLVGLALL